MGILLYTAADSSLVYTNHDTHTWLSNKAEKTSNQTTTEIFVPGIF